MRFEELSEAARDICRETTGITSSVAQCLWYCLERGGDPHDVINDIIESILETLEVREDEH